MANNFNVTLPEVKEIASKGTYDQPFVGGHRLCAGCNAGTVVRQVLTAAQSDEYQIVVVNATGCLEVATSIYPYTSWNVPWVHVAFENAAAVASGIEAAYRALWRKGRLNKKFRFIVFGGDGGTYDIGFQALSGALERGHQLLYVLYDNEAYMNTGIQRSSSTPFGANTTTSPAGNVIPGKPQMKKRIVDIVAFHRIPYVAQAIPGQPFDLMKKVRKALSYDGPTFMAVYSSCTRGHRFPPEKSVEVTKKAWETYYWPLFEIEQGQWRITMKPPKKLPIQEWLKMEGRFAHLLKPGNEHLVKMLQDAVDEYWDYLVRMEEMTKEKGLWTWVPPYTRQVQK